MTTQQRNERGQFIRSSIPTQTVELDVNVNKMLIEKEAQERLMSELERADKQFNENMKKIERSDKIWKWTWSIVLSLYAGYIFGKIMVIFFK